MGANSEISWTDHTFNPWLGCTKVSPACDNCYAESWAKRTGHPELWAGNRRRTSAANWQQPLKWNRMAEAAGKRARVFCASLADVFDNQVPVEWRADLWGMIRATPHLDWLLLTKRPQNVAKMLPLPVFWPGAVPIEWGTGWPWPNVWLGTTAEDAHHYRQRWARLVEVPAHIRFLSYEPALGPIGDLDLSNGCAPNWVIVGGESGPNARPMDPAWVRDVRDQCARAGVPFHFKQWGGRDKKATGRMLDGAEWLEFPEAA